jgi:hypothetical protein
MYLAAGLPLNGMTYCVPSRYGYLYSHIIQARIQATEYAQRLTKEKDEYALRDSIISKDFRHRMGAAFTFGMQLRAEEGLFKLIADADPLVSQAGREAAVYISKHKYKESTDYGPFPAYTMIQKEQAATNWRRYFLYMSSK